MFLEIGLIFQLSVGLLEFGVLYEGFTRKFKLLVIILGFNWTLLDHVFLEWA